MRRYLALCITGLLVPCLPHAAAAQGSVSPNLLTEEVLDAIRSQTTAAAPTTEGPWIDLYVSSEAGGDYPLGESCAGTCESAGLACDDHWDCPGWDTCTAPAPSCSGTAGLHPSQPLRDFNDLSLKLAGMTDRCGVRIHFDQQDVWNGMDVGQIDLVPNCSDRDQLGIWVRSSREGLPFIGDCTDGLVIERDIFAVSGNGWVFLQDFYLRSCEIGLLDIVSVVSGSDGRALVLNGGGEAGDNVFTAHGNGGEQGNELVVIGGSGWSQTTVGLAHPGRATILHSNLGMKRIGALVIGGASLSVIASRFMDAPAAENTRAIKWTAGGTASTRGRTIVASSVAFTQNGGAMCGMELRAYGNEAPIHDPQLRIHDTTILGWNQHPNAAAICAHIAGGERVTARVEGSCTLIAYSSKSVSSDCSGRGCGTCGGGTQMCSHDGDCSSGVTCEGASSSVDFDFTQSSWDDTTAQGPAGDGHAWRLGAGTGNVGEWTSIEEALDGPPAGARFTSLFDGGAAPSTELGGIASARCESPFSAVLDPAIPAWFTGSRIDRIVLNRELDDPTIGAW